MELFLDPSQAPEYEDDTNTEEFYRNLVEDISEDELETIAEMVYENLEADRKSRASWESTITKGIALLGLELEELSEPFEGACSAHHPLIIESAVKFQSKASPELLPAKGPVKTQILGNITPEKEAQAQRIQDFMNYQLTEVMSEYYEDTERMLFWLPIIGSAFKKTYYSPTLDRPKSEFVPCDQFIVPFAASSLDTAPRYSHIIYKTENDLKRDMASGLYMKCEVGDTDCDIQPSMPEFSDIRRKMDQIIGLSPSSSDTAYTLVEQHVDLDLGGSLRHKDGIACPYIVTMDYGSKKILSIRRNWNEEDPTYQRRNWFTHYKFVPGLGFYGVGFIHLLGNLETTLTTVLRSLVDSGQFANMQGGFKLKGLKIVGNNQAIAPGEFKDVESAVQDLSKAIYPLPFKEPSQVLYAMLEFMERRGQQFADSTEQIIADSTNYGPVGTTIALLEASMKFFTSIHKRGHLAQKNELKILYQINSETLQDEYPYDVPGVSRTILRQDFNGKVQVVPASDPNIASQSQRVMMAEAVLNKAIAAPQLHNIREILKNYYLTLGVEQPERFLVEEAQAVEQDPISDIQDATLGKPIKAFPGQHHDAHIAIKTAFIQDPANGASPLMQIAVQPLLANIREHMILKYKEQIGGMLQQSEQGGTEDEQVLQQVMAEAAQQIMQANQQAAQNAQVSDPERMVAEAEIIKAKAQQQRVQVEAFDKQSKNALAAKQLEIEQAKVIAKAAETDAKLANELKRDQFKEGSKMVMQALSEQDEITNIKSMLNEAKAENKKLKNQKDKPVAKKPE